MKSHFRRAALCAALVAGLISSPTAAPSPNLVISQVYGGGGNSGAVFTHDFIEVFNRGASAVSLEGMSLQYTSATGTANFGSATTLLTELPSLTLLPGQYFLVQEGAGAGGTTPLPEPDLVDPTPIAMAAGAGKVALVSGTTSLGCNGGSVPCSAAQLGRIVDLIGYGSANFFETSPAPALSNTTAAFRADNGCTDTDNNTADFTAAAPAPRNTASPLNPCQGAPLLSIDDVTIMEGNAGTTTASFTVSLSSPASTTVTFRVATGGGTATADEDYLATAADGSIAPGSTAYAFDVTVNGDVTFEPAETFIVTLTNITGADPGRTEGRGTIANDDEPPALAIHTIQGSGDASPFAGQEVVTTGIVTARKSNGFFLQTADGSTDGDSQTSEGIFVFTSTLPSVAAGAAVAVRGTVSEFFDLTEISTTMAQVTVLSSGHVLPAPVTITNEILQPAGPQLERFEGMRMHAPALISVAPTEGFGETFTVLSTMPRPMREPGIPISAPVPPDPTSGEIEPGVPRWDENPERLILDSDGVAGLAAVTVTSNVTFTNVTGPLDFTFGAFKLLPEAALERTPDMTAVPVPPPAPGEFTVAGFNIENFTNSGAAGDRQRRKAALAIRTVLRAPDVVGHVEIASLAALQALAAQVNADAAAAGEPDPGYEAFLIPFGENNTQHVGFLVKRLRVNVTSVTQERTTDLDPTETDRPLHDRPPLVLHATFGAEARPVIVVVNHLRSFIDIEDDGPGGDGPRVRAKRTAQAESVATLLQELQLANPGTPVISIGDYNAYEFNDGYTDPIAVIKGAPTPDEEVVVDESPDLVNPDFVNLTDTLPREQRYSFIFEGTPQALDHMIVNAVARSHLTRYVVARNNADFPAAFAAGFAGDATRPERNSDHDMPVAYFDLAAPSIQNLQVTPDLLGPPNHKMIDVTVSYAVSDDSGPVTCTLSVASNEAQNGPDDGNTPIDWQVMSANLVQLRAERSGTGSGRVYTVTVTCADALGNSSAASAPVLVKK